MFMKNKLLIVREPTIFMKRKMVNYRQDCAVRSVDQAGIASEALTVTETVSAHGFLCAYQPPAKEGAIVEVYLARNGQQFAGKAKVARVDWPETPGQRVDFRFIETPTEWILR